MENIRNLRVAGDPADVGHACKLILWMDIKDVLYSQGSSKEITGSGVDDTLWFSGGSRGLGKPMLHVRDCC